MNAIQKMKAVAHGLDNVDIIEEFVSRLDVMCPETKTKAEEIISTWERQFQGHEFGIDMLIVQAIEIGINDMYRRHCTKQHG